MRAEGWRCLSHSFRCWRRSGLCRTACPTCEGHRCIPGVCSPFTGEKSPVCFSLKHFFWVLGGQNRTRAKIKVQNEREMPWGGHGPTARLGPQPEETVILIRVCAQAHACTREKLLPAGKFMPMPVRLYHAVLAAVTRLWSSFNLRVGTLAKPIAQRGV